MEGRKRNMVSNPRIDVGFSTRRSRACLMIHDTSDVFAHWICVHAYLIAELEACIVNIMM